MCGVGERDPWAWIVCVLFVLYTTSGEELPSPSARLLPVGVGFYPRRRTLTSRYMPIRSRYIVHREKNISCRRVSLPHPAQSVEVASDVPNNPSCCPPLPSPLFGSRAIISPNSPLPLLFCLCATPQTRNLESMFLYMIRRLVSGGWAGRLEHLGHSVDDKGSCVPGLASDAFPSRR